MTIYEINTGFDPTSATSTPDAVFSIRTAVEFPLHRRHGRELLYKRFMVGSIRHPFAGPLRRTVPAFFPKGRDRPPGGPREHQAAGTLAAPPWRLDISAFAKPGGNRIEVLVCNTLANHYVTIPTHYRGSTVSGLLGPVRLEVSNR